jgi:cob(I)alamin adenosyltransferase
MDDYEIENVNLDLERRLDEISNKADQLAENLTDKDEEASLELEEINTELNAIRMRLTEQDTDDQDNPREDLELLEGDIARLEDEIQVLLQAVLPDSTVVV